MGFGSRRFRLEFLLSRRYIPRGPPRAFCPQKRFVTSSVFSGLAQTCSNIQSKAGESEAHRKSHSQASRSATNRTFMTLVTLQLFSPGLEFEDRCLGSMS